MGIHTYNRIREQLDKIERTIHQIAILDHEVTDEDRKHMMSSLVYIKRIRKDLDHLEETRTRSPQSPPISPTWSDDVPETLRGAHYGEPSPAGIYAETKDRSVEETHR